MGRKGDIDTKSVASRLPMSVYIKLLSEASTKKMTLSAYVGDILSSPGENLKLGGTISFEEKEKLISSLYNRIKILENKLIVDLENQKKNLKKDVIAEVRILPTNETTYSFTFIKQIHNSDFRKMESAIYSGLAAERKFYDNI